MMRKALFAAGNFWLFAALVLVIGRTNESSVCFFGVGRYFSTLGYGFLTFCCMALGAALLFAAWKAKTDV